MPKPFANSQPITPSLISGDWLLGIQTGNSTGDNGLPQMKYIKLSQLTDWVRSNFGEMWRYRGEFSASLPSDPQDGDYFLATATFTVGADTYTKDHLYAYNGSSWDDISNILTQYASQSQVTNIDDRLGVLEVKVDAMGDGIVYKGKVATYADLANIVDPQTGWEYYVTGDAAFYIYNGSSWDQIDNGIVQTITDGDTSHAPSSDAVYNALTSEATARANADSDLKDAIDGMNARVENLEQEHGSYHEVDVKSVYTIPSGKAKNWSVNVLRGVGRVENQGMKNCDFSTNTFDYWGYQGATTNLPTVSGGVCSFLAFGQFGGIYQNSLSAVNGHKYLVAFMVKSTSANTPMRIVTNLPSIQNYDGFTAGTSFGLCAVIATADADTTSGVAQIRDARTGSWDNIYVDYGIIRDLTLYFNGSIPSDADTIAEIQQNYPWLLEPSAYNAGTVRWTRYEAIRSKARNLWNGQYESGLYYPSTGAKVADANSVRCTNLIPVKANTTYYLKADQNLVIGEWDADGNYIANTFNGKNTTFTTRGNTASISFYSSVLVTTATICINKSDSLNGTFTPYWTPVTLTLSSPVELKGVGTVSEEAYLNEDGEAWKTNTIGSVDLGTLSWTPSSTSGCFYASIGAVNYSQFDHTIQLLCAKYVYSTMHDSTDYYGANQTIKINTYGTKELYIHDDSCVGYTGQQFAEAVTGVIVYYPLATPNDPTPITPELNNLLPTEVGGTIESVLTNPIDDSMTLGYLNL